MAGILTRLVRSTMLDALAADHQRTARAKGAPPWRVTVVHALRTALPPVVTVIGLQAGGLLAGTVVTETIFAWPGVGRLLIQAITFRDYPLVQGCILLISITYVTMNLLVDLAYAWLDPRIRYQ
jgi:ABC-type dipeptide/oligopeptide/nickel transport system permease component